MRGQVDVEHRITVCCAVCGDTLECDGATDSIEVEPCQKCMAEAFDEGKKEE